MKILYINALYSPHIGGGAEITLQTLVEGMQRSGHEVAVLTIGPEPGLTREVVNGVTVWRAGFRNLYFHHRSAQIGAWRRLLWHIRDRYNGGMRKYVREVVKQFKPDVASCHNLSGWSIAAWDELTALGVPIVQVLHDQYLLCPKSTMFKDGDRCRTQCTTCKVLRLGHSEKSSQVAAVVGVSQFIRDKLFTHGYFQGIGIKASIPNIRNMDLSAIKIQPRVQDGSVIFGFIGTISPNKGVELLLNAFMSSAGANWKLRVAGTGLNEYERYLRKTFSDPRVEFLGRVEPREFFSKIDATVIPSIWEDTLPGVVFESLIFGRPVLGSDRGGIPEMISPSVGVLFTPTTEALAAVLKDFASSLHQWRGRFTEIQAAGEPYTDESAWLSRYEEVFSGARDECRTRA